MFVLGNICRSPAAEEVMRRLVNDAGLEHEFFLDSAGLIDYHEGEPADARMRHMQHAEGTTLLTFHVRCGMMISLISIGL